MNDKNSDNAKTNNKKYYILLKICTLIILAVSEFFNVKMPNQSAQIGYAIGSALGKYIIFMILTYLPLLLIKNKDLRQKVSAIVIFVISLIYACVCYFIS